MRRYGISSSSIVRRRARCSPPRRTDSLQFLQVAPYAYPGPFAGAAWVTMPISCWNISPSAAHARTACNDSAQVSPRCIGARYGWHRDNTIGTTPQCNETSDDWVTFWRERRLRFQLQCAAARGCGAALWQKGERLLEKVDALLLGLVPAPSLLHGDLWSGNFAILESGVPGIFDPAVYYGDRETDLAMTELFGCYSREFYEAYHAHYPLADGYPLRKILYFLYHVLNHYNLFGGGYAGQAGRMIDRLLSETN